MLILVFLMSFLNVSVSAEDETFTIVPNLSNFNGILDNVSITGIIDHSYYGTDYASNATQAAQQTMTLPLYKVTVGSSYTEIKIDYDINSDYSPQMFSKKQLSRVNGENILPVWETSGIIDWQNGGIITRTNYCSTDELYNEEKDKLTAYTTNSNATYLLAIYADVEEYVYNEDRSFQVAKAKALVLFEWENETAGLQIDKTILQTALDAVPTTGYYTSGDRYNGKVADTIDDPGGSFWADMQAIVDAAQAVYDDEEATQEEVNSAAATLDQSDATSALSVAIAKLIPNEDSTTLTPRLNATKLYEAIQDCGGESNDDNTYTSASWTLYAKALSDAQSLLASYFSGGTPTNTNTPENQGKADGAANALTEAKAALVKRADRYQVIRSGVALKEIELLAELYDPAKLDSNKYTIDSWAALVSARTDALSVLAQSETITELSEPQFEEQAAAMDALRAACYGLTEKEGPITVYLSVSDSFAPRQTNPRPMAVTVKELSLPAGATVNDALSAAAISLGRSDTFQEIAVYLNGLFYIPEQASVFGGVGNYRQVGLRDGDCLTISYYEIPWEWSNDGSYRVAKALGEYKDDVRYQTISAPETVKAGESFSLSVTADGAMPENHTGTVAPWEGAAIYASAAYPNKTDAETAAVTEFTDVVTGSDGKATVTLYAEGWCVINAFSTESDAGGLCNGPSVLIYVEPTDDLEAVKAALREELTAAYENENYPETFFSDTDWGKIETAYNTGITGITDANASGDAREAELAALQTIRSIQTAADNYNSSNLSAFRRLMDSLPEDVEKLDASSEPTIQSLISCYGAMTEYQYGQLTPAEEARYQSIKAKYESGFAPATLFELTVVMDDSKVAAADREALAAMIQYLQENTATCDTYSQVGGTKIAGLFTFNTADTMAYVGTTFAEITTSAAMQTVAVCVSPDYAAYLLVRDAGGTLSAADGSWTISDQSLEFTFDDVNVVYVTTGETFTVNGTQYEVQNITVSGMDEDQFAERTYTYYDSSDYKGKNGVQYINMNFPGAFRRFTMPYSDVTVTVAWGPVSGTTDEIAAARESAAETIRSVYASYQQPDYSEANWTALTAVKDAALTALETAASLDDVRTIRKNALADMASIEKLSGSVAGLPDFGRVVGQVHISIENTTFPDCPYEQFRGEFLSGWYDLCERDTMMTAILKALKTEGLSWEGTGGGGDAYGITYLSRIYYDADNSGRYDVGEPRLGQFDGENGSGWMGTLNDFFVNSGFSDFSVGGVSPYVVEHGDEIKVVYTQNLGIDVGGTWSNSDTSLSDLQFSVGTLSPGFESGVLNYDLIIPGEYATLLVTPSAVNKNFMVKTFLNAYNKDSAYYKRTESLFVKPGDVIYVGVGEQGWPTMNSQGAEAGSYAGTKYTITVYAEGAGGIVARIDAVYKDIQKINYDNYTEYAATIEKIAEDYEALSDKSAVTNAAKLTELRELIDGFKALDKLKTEIANLPKNITEVDRSEVNTAKAHYDALAAAQQNLLTVAETNKLLKAVNTLTLIDELKAIGATKDFVSTEANTEADVMAALRTWLTGKTSAKDEDVIINITGFTDANSSRDGSYTATVSFTLGSGSQAATQKKAISGTIKRSSDAGVSKIVINGKTTASGSGTSWTATLPYGSDPTKATFAITAAEKATPSAPVMAKTDGSEWTFTVTAEDGTKKDYTVKLSVSEVELTVLDSNIYDVSDDTVVTALSPVAVSGLDAIVADDLDLPEGTKEASVWLMLKIKAQSSDELTLAVTAWYAADDKEADKIPDDVLKNVELTLTVPLAGTEYAKVLYDSAYLDAKGSSSGITFDMAAAGDYTLIPDAHIAIVTFHEFDGTNNRQIVFYRGDAGNDLPAASKSGAAFKGWYAKADCTGDKFTTVSATLPTDLYPLWSYGVKTEEVGDIEDRVEVSAIVQGDVATITVESKKPCAVIVEKPDGSFERLEAFDNGDGSCSFVQEDYDADMVFYVAALGDYDENGVLEPADLTAANLTIIGDVDLEPLSAFIMGAKDGKLRTVDLAKLFLHLARNDVEW